MAHKKRSRLPKPPDLPQIESCTAWASPNIAASKEIEYSLLRGGSSAKVTARGLKIRESAFIEHDLSDTQLPYLEAADVMFEGCSASNAEWQLLRGARIAWKTCRLTGFRCNEAKVTDLSFQNCNMEYVQMRFAKIPGASFENCNLRHADFSGSDLTGSTFSNCDLTGAAFSESDCRSVDLRSSTLDGLVMGVQQLSGLIVSPLQAAEIAKVAGVIVLDKHEELPEPNQHRRR